MGSVAIKNELISRKIVCPSVYKYEHGDTRYARFAPIVKGDRTAWNATSVMAMLKDPVYIGDLVNLKTEVVNYKTKKTVSVPPERQIVSRNAHESIISRERFDAVQQILSTHRCPTNHKRFNLFRGKLFCDCCGHPLAISKKQLLAGVTDMYLCMYHYGHPEVCPKTHRIYHDMLYPYVLQQIRGFAKSMKSRKINLSIGEYVSIEALAPEILDAVIERIEIGHVTRKSRPGNVIHIYWKLK